LGISQTSVYIIIALLCCAGKNIGIARSTAERNA